MHKPFRHEEQLELQLRTMEISQFDLRVVNPHGKVVEQRDGLFLSQVKDILEWLHEKNEKGNSIEVRPHGEHGLSLISGLSNQQVHDAKVSGYEPALVVAYATDRFQLWLNHDRKLLADAATQVSQKICRRLGGDCERSHWDSYGYLVGFMVRTTEKPFRVELVSHSGEIFTASKSINDRLATAKP